MGRIAAARADHGTALLGMMPPGTLSTMRGNLPGTPVQHRPPTDQNMPTGVPDDYRTRVAAAVQQVQNHILPRPSGPRWRPA
eukprot:5852746-Pyramimonas_sp.AAC.1